MTSYQRRLQSIRYWQQCVVELEQIARQMAVQLNQAGLRPKLFGGLGIDGDHFITPYNDGEFGIELALIRNAPPSLILAA